MTATQQELSLQERIEALKNKKQETSTTTTTVTQEEEVFDQVFEGIENNTFFKIQANKQLDDEQKRAEFAKALTYDREKTKEENQARMKEFVTFKNFLNKQRQDLHVELIKLMDPESVAELSEMFEKMFGGVKEFQDRLGPMNDILMALYTLRTDGGSELQAGMFNEIQDDKIAQAQRLQDIAQMEAALKADAVTIAKTEREIEELSKKKKYKFFGGLSEATKAEIDEKTALLAQQNKDKADKEANVELLKTAPVGNTKFAKYNSEKEIIARMLATPREEHVANSKALIAAALKFIQDSRQGGLKALEKLDGLQERVNQQDVNNYKLQGIYATLTDASTDAAKTNQAIADELAKAPDKETLSARLKRENAARDVQEFIDTSNSSALDTIKVYADLGQEGSSIKTMKNTVTELRTEVDQQTSSGVASVAGGISTALTAYDQALVNETAKAVEGASDEMKKTTKLTNQNQAIQQALGIGKDADKLKEAVQQMEETTKLLDFVKETKEDGMENLKSVQSKIKDLADQVREKQAEVNAVGSKLDMQDSKGELAGKFDKSATNDNTKTAAKTTPKTAPKKAAGGKSGPSLNDL